MTATQSSKSKDNSRLNHQSQISSSKNPRPPGLKPPRFKSISTKLFLWVMGSALIGLGGMAFLFGEVIKFQTEDQIKDKLNARVNSIDGILGQAETEAKALATSVATLHIRQAQTPETYIELTFKQFINRPSFVVGLGFGQSEYGVLRDRQWFFSYFYPSPGGSEAIGQLMPPPYDNIRYVDENEPRDFYPETDYYWRDYMLTQKAVWADPYQYGSALQTTFYSPIFDDGGKWLGTVVIDVDSTSFNESLGGTVLGRTGKFALLTASGKIIAYPSAPEQATNAQTYQAIPDLETVWSQLLQGQSGLLEGNTGYWAYARIPRSNWIAVASVPYSTVFGRIALIAIGATVIVGILLALVVAMFARYLNRRLQPILDECNKLAVADRKTLARMQNRDELEQLSTSFFYLLTQIAANEEKVRQEVARQVKDRERLKQAALGKQESEALQAEVGQILEVVSAVEQGELTVQAPVSHRVTGLVADTLNRLIEKLAQIVSVVMSAAEQVTQGAEKLERFAVSVTEQAREQAQSIARVQDSLETVNNLSQETAHQAVAADGAVQLARQAVRQGQQEMAGMTAGIATLQQGTEQIVKRTQTLTDFVELAAQFTKDQKRVAAMTRVLAMNASLLAARACEQQDPEQFASISSEFKTIAKQVNDLAVQTNQSLLLLQQRTFEMETVVSGFEGDVEEIGHLVNDFTLEIGQSSQAFDNLKGATEQVAIVGQRVTQSSQAIAASTLTTLQSMQNIAAMATKTEQQARLTREQSGSMGQMARTLFELVQFFRLSPDQKRNDSEAEVTGLNCNFDNKGHDSAAVPQFADPK